jgi:hypothetical protein
MILNTRNAVRSLLIYCCQQVGSISIYFATLFIPPCTSITGGASDLTIVLGWATVIKCAVFHLYLFSNCKAEPIPQSVLLTRQPCWSVHRGLSWGQKYDGKHDCNFASGVRLLNLLYPVKITGLVLQAIIGFIMSALYAKYVQFLPLSIYRGSNQIYNPTDLRYTSVHLL